MDFWSLYLRSLGKSWKRICLMWVGCFLSSWVVGYFFCLFLRSFFSFFRGWKSCWCLFFIFLKGGEGRMSCFLCSLIVCWVSFCGGVFLYLMCFCLRDLVDWLWSWMFIVGWSWVIWEGFLKIRMIYLMMMMMMSMNMRKIWMI